MLSVMNPMHGSFNIFVVRVCNLCVIANTRTISDNPCITLNLTFIMYIRSKKYHKHKLIPYKLFFHIKTSLSFPLNHYL